MAEQRQNRTGCLPAALTFGILAATGMAAVALAVVISLVSGRGFMGGSGEGGVDEFPELNRVWSCGRGEVVAVRIPVHGILTRTAATGMFGKVTDPVGEILRCIQDATQDDTVRAIILEIDSPGGEVTASDEIYKALCEFKWGRSDRVVVALCGDMAASGALYLAMAADHIIVQPTTITGSIGVLISTLNFKGLGDKLGIHDVTIKAGRNKDLLNPLREMNEEERALIQEVVDAMYDRFVAIVAEGRGLTVEQVEQFADGRILTAGQALETGLVDEEGYWGDAVARTAELLNVPDVKVFKYEEETSLLSLLMASKADMRNPLQILLEPQSPRMLYIWNP